MAVRIPPLLSGGLITNYHCTSECRHCLYRCSPKREKGYADYATARECFRTARRLGCAAMHIGGGESFLDQEGLAEVLRAAQREGMAVEYVETNSAWFISMDRAVELLLELKGLGLSQLLVSMSPLHNEFTPLSKVSGVVTACARAGLGVFPWVRSFLPDMEQLDPDRQHGLQEYETRFGPGYLASIPERYWVHWGGRALETFREELPVVGVDDVLAGAEACRTLLDTTHFHFDLNGNYVPGLCAGLAVACEDVENELSPQRYPIVTTLVEHGVSGLAELASELNVRPSRETYMNKCDLCDDLRAGLVRAGWSGSGELAPTGQYA